ncbi:MAG TPA: cupin domain-containing protein [Novosphingobium sp.]
MTTLTRCPTAIDLRAFAATAAAAADPFGAGRTVLPLREAPVEVACVVLAAGAGKVPARTGDRWLVAAEGAVHLTAGERQLELTGNQSCVIPAGTPFAWASATGARLIAMAYTAGAGAASELVPIDLSAELAPSGAPLADLLIGATPACRNHTDFRSADGTFTCGVWDSTPYHRRAMRYAHFELMVLLAGSVTFVDEEATAATFRRGDIFLIEQGASCSWESREDVAKIYAIYRPAT